MTEKTPIGVIIVGHGKYGSAVLAAAELIMGPQSDCVAIGVESAHDMEEAMHRLNDAARRLDRGEGVLALTDMFGGTPTNIALSLMKNHKAEVVTGVNLPMLIKVFENRDRTALPELAKMAGAAARAGIVDAGGMLRDRGKGRGGQGEGKADK